MDSAEIVLKIKRGDDAVFSYVIDEYSNYLAKVIRGVYALNTQDTEDIIAETMLSVWRNSKKLRGDLNFKSYLATIARNKAIDYVRKMRVALVELDNELSAGCNVENDFLRKELTEFLSQKINEAKEPDKSIMILKYQHGLKSKEIADRLNISRNVVDIRLSRQRSRLKKSLLGMGV